MHCPFPVFYFVLLGVGFGVPSFAHNDHLAKFVQKTRNVDNVIASGGSLAFRIVDSTEDSSLTGYIPISVSVETGDYVNAYNFLVGSPNYSTSNGFWNTVIRNCHTGQ